jgi:hypothetical protein
MKWDETALSVEVINGDFLHLQMSVILHCLLLWSEINGDFLHLQMSVILHCLLLWSEINGDFLHLQIFCILNLEIAC